MLPSALIFAAAFAAPADVTKPVLTVLYFDNNTGSAEYDVLRKGVADMIITDLVAWDGVSVVEREKLEQVVAEMKLQRSKRFDPATAVKIGKFLGAQYLLTGTLNAASPEVRIDARLVKAEDAKVVAGATVRGPKEKIFDLEQELVDKLTSAIDLKVKDMAARRRARAPDLDALLAYSKAIDLSDQGKVEEAQKAMQEVVSRAPTFLMAREKKEEISKRLKELQERRKDMVTESALELGRLSEAALKDAGPFEKLDEIEQKRRLAWRVVRARFLARLLKQSLSWRQANLRVVLRGKEAQAIKVMRAFIENEQQLADEYGAWQRAHSGLWLSLELPAATANLMRDAALGEVSLSSPFDLIVRFVFEGVAADGPSLYHFAPTPADLLPAEANVVSAALDARVKAALEAAQKADAAQRQRAEQEATALMDRKAVALLAQDKVEEAIVEYQRILDVFPTGPRNDWYEKQIKKLIGAEHDHNRGSRERWAKGLREACKDDMDIRVGENVVLHDRIKHMGHKALEVHAAELEKACSPLMPRLRSMFASVYRGLAQQAAYLDDCDALRLWYRKYLAVGGSVSDMKGYAKNWHPWCDIADMIEGAQAK